jgi:hypothetical protein
MSVNLALWYSYRNRVKTLFCLSFILFEIICGGGLYDTVNLTETSKFFKIRVLNKEINDTES